MNAGPYGSWPGYRPITRETSISTIDQTNDFGTIRVSNISSSPQASPGRINPRVSRRAIERELADLRMRFDALAKEFDEQAGDLDQARQAARQWKQRHDEVRGQLLADLEKAEKALRQIALTPEAITLSALHLGMLTDECQVQDEPGQIIIYTGLAQDADGNLIPYVDPDEAAEPAANRETNQAITPAANQAQPSPAHQTQPEPTPEPFGLGAAVATAAIGAGLVGLIERRKAKTRRIIKQVEAEQ